MHSIKRLFLFLCVGYIYFIGKFNLPIKVGNDAGDDAKEVFEESNTSCQKSDSGGGSEVCGVIQTLKALW